MKELELKSPARSSKKLAGVRLNADVAFFGIYGSQLSSKMPGIRLNYRESDGVVVVTSEQYPDEERWIFPSAINNLTWKSKEADETVSGA